MSGESNKFLRWLALAAILLVVLAGSWVRLSRLAAYPWFQADEAYYGLQALRLLDGDSIEIRTTSGNVVSPLFVASQLPVTLVAGPSIWSIRLPPALSGLLTSTGLYFLLRKRLGEREALIAGLLYLVLPPAIDFGRVGCEYSQSPLVGVIAIGLAWSRRPILAVAWLGLALLVHPTNILLVCLMGPIAFVSWFEGRGEIPRRRHAVAGVGLAALMAVFAFALKGNANLAQHLTASRSPGAFLEGFAQFLFGLKQAPGPRENDAIRWAIWGALPLATAVVFARLLKRGDWRRLAIVGGWIAMLLAFNLAAGANVLTDSALRRYGAVLLVPTALALTLIAEEWLRVQLAPTMRPTRRLAIGASLLVAGLFLPATYLANEYAWNKAEIRAHLTGPLEPDPYTLAADEITTSLGPRTPGQPRAVVAQYEFFNGLQMNYLLHDRPDLKVVPLLGLYEVWQMRTDPAGDPLLPRRERLAEALRQDGVALALPGTSPDFGAGQIDQTLADHFPGAAFDRKMIGPQEIIRLVPLTTAEANPRVHR